jgi:NAD(P)H dehydrogenase (quinone)
MNIYADSQVDALRRAMSSGEYAAPDDAPMAYVVRDELGAAAAAILGTSGHEGVTYHGTGPASVTHAELAEAASRASGSPVRFVPLTQDEGTARLTAAGLPAPIVDVLSRFQRAAREGAFDLVSGDIRRLTGRKPTPAADFLVSALQRPV